MISRKNVDFFTFFTAQQCMNILKHGLLHCSNCNLHVVEKIGPFSTTWRISVPNSPWGGESSTVLLNSVENSVPHSPRRLHCFLLRMTTPGSRCRFFIPSFPLLWLGARALSKKRGEKIASPFSTSPALCRWKVSTRLLAGMEKGRALSPKQTEQTTATGLR